MPTPTLFIVFSFLLRTLEGIGTAVYTTVSYALITQYYPEKKATVVVSDPHFSIGATLSVCVWFNLKVM